MFTGGEYQYIYILGEVKFKHVVKKGGLIIITLISYYILGGKRFRMIYFLSYSWKLLNSKVFKRVLAPSEGQESLEGA